MTISAGAPMISSPTAKIAAPAGADIILPVVDAPAEGSCIMGMRYDRAKKCWRLDYPCRVNGMPTHLKDVVHGDMRATQNEAMHRYLALADRAKTLTRSLKFKEAIDQYLADNPSMPGNAIRIINFLRREIGNASLSDFKNTFSAWARKQSKRNIMRWRRVDGKMELCDTGKPISPATVQAYMRYAKAVLRAGGHGDAFSGITIGRRAVRRRAIEPWEMLALEESCMRLFPWFYPAFDFARCNPIRPEDLFALTVEDHVKADDHGGLRIVYAPKKTYRKTGKLARPLVWEHQKAWYGSLTRGLLFPRPGGGSMGDYYRFVWRKIRKDGGLPDIQFYDLRHHAVAWMRSRGVDDWRIASAAGWSGTQMIADYDPDNAHLISKYDRENVAKCSTNVAPVQFEKK
jgi:integrase